jgi:hypothetical protein
MARMGGIHGAPVVDVGLMQGGPDPPIPAFHRRVSPALPMDRHARHGYSPPEGEDLWAEVRNYGAPGCPEYVPGLHSVAALARWRGFLTAGDIR